MVKRVIDIIPPGQPARPAGGPAAETDEMPRIQEFSGEASLTAEPKPEAKPKITFISKPGKAPAAKKRSGGVFKAWPLKLAVVLGLAAAAMYAADLKFAKATIKIWPETSDLRQETKVIVDTAAKSVDTAKNIIPAITVSVDDTVTAEAPATGKKSVQGKAQGAIKIFNNYTTIQRLVKGTRFQAPLEKFQPALANDEAPWFRTAEEVVIEPKSSAIVNVVADGAGEKYNIEPSVFSVPGLVGTPQYTFIYGQSFEKFGGGTQGAAPQVTADDLVNAKKVIVAAADAAFKEKLQQKTPPGFVLLADTAKFTFDAPVISAKAGDSIAKISCQVHGKATAVAYGKSDLDTLGSEFILGKVAEGNIADKDSLRMESSYAGVDPASGKPSLALVAQMMTYAGMEESDLKKGLSEKGRAEAEIFLRNQPGTKDAKIQLSPPWRFAIPRDLDRIEVQTILE